MKLSARSTVGGGPLVADWIHFIRDAGGGAFASYKAQLSDILGLVLASPTLTGDPKAPTPSTGDNDTSIATSAFVQTTVNARVSAKITVASSAPSSPATNDVWIDTT
jgi:hypothetical protein